MYLSTKPRTPADLLQEEIARQRMSLAAAETFLAIYGPRIPSGIPCLLTFGPRYPILTMYAPGIACAPPTPENRQRLLSAAADVFGPAGWTRRLDMYRTDLDWVQVFGGVEVCLRQAERASCPQDGTPVLPAAFPLTIGQGADGAALLAAAPAPAPEAWEVQP